MLCVPFLLSIFSLGALVRINLASNIEDRFGPPVVAGNEGLGGGGGGGGGGGW
jgi:hypothetical protein